MDEHGDLQLKHFGIKGMRWGVRRFQNKDGSLTAKGRKKIEETYARIRAEGKDGKTLDDSIEFDKKNSGVNKLNSSTDVVRKGSTFQRVANDEKIDSRRKYVSLLPYDNATYSSMYEVLGLDPKKEAFTYKLTAKKDVKIANAESVIMHLIDTYGDKPIRDLYSEFVKLGGKPGDSFSLKKADKQRWMHDYKTGVDIKLSNFLNSKMYGAHGKSTTLDEISDYYKKKGYDGFVDAEDFVAGIGDYPIVLINPQRSVTLSKKTHLGGYDH